MQVKQEPGGPVSTVSQGLTVATAALHQMPRQMPAPPPLYPGKSTQIPPHIAAGLLPPRYPGHRPAQPPQMPQNIVRNIHNMPTLFVLFLVLPQTDHSFCIYSTEFFRISYSCSECSTGDQELFNDDSSLFIQDLEA